MSVERPTLLAIQHVSWEGPHRILDACGSLGVRTAMPLSDDVLPDHAEVAGAVVMGGPMNVDEVELHPGLAGEREWLATAVRIGMPILGICLGAQLLARALGAEVRPGEEQEIGFAPVEVHDPADPIVGALAPRTSVLHWHGDVFDSPPGPSAWLRQPGPRLRRSATVAPGACSSTQRPTQRCSTPGWQYRRWPARRHRLSGPRP
jgi:GMP synthase (glutamine-hydrolysing)